MNRITSTFVLLATTAVGTTVVAQESARVVSSTPVMQQVGVPRQACATMTNGAPPQCSTQNIYENRAVGYKVIYEYAGKQYTVQLPQDPGPTLQLSVSVNPASNSPVASAPPPSSAPMSASDPSLYADSNAVMMAQNTGTSVPFPTDVYYSSQPGYVGYYDSPYYGSWGTSISLGFFGGYRGGFGGGHRGHYHRGGHRGRR